MENREKDQYLELYPDVFVIGLGASLNVELLDNLVASRLLHLVKKREYYTMVSDDSPIGPAFRASTLEYIGRYSESSLVVFLITDFDAARTATVKDFIKVVRVAAESQERVIVYHIILDMLRDFKRFSYAYHGKHMGCEREAFRIKALPCYGNHDYVSSSTGYKRAVELMTRILGLDLPLSQSSFPNFEWDMLERMARHINRESFNSNGPRIGAIAKYKLDSDGHPIVTEEMILAFDRNIDEITQNRNKLEVVKTYRCPHCGYNLGSQVILWDEITKTVICSACKQFLDARELVAED